MTEILFVVPTYNRVNTILKTLPVNMNICQRNNVDIVIIDNNSPDNTGMQLKSMFPDVQILINSENIGLKGSFKKIVTEFCENDKIVVILSDEDIIFEPGLVQLIDKIKNNELFSSNDKESILYFNYINKVGKDFYYRRNQKTIKDWDEIEIFSFGLISAVGFRISSQTISKIDWEKHLDARNVYPHLALFQQEGILIDVIGLPLAALFSEENVSFLHDEWASKSHHFSLNAVSDYISYHSENFNTHGAKKFRKLYKIVGFLFRNNKNSTNILMIYNALVMLIRFPRFGFYYLLRKFGW